LELSRSRNQGPLLCSKLTFLADWLHLRWRQQPGAGGLQGQRQHLLSRLLFLHAAWAALLYTATVDKTKMVVCFSRFISLFWKYWHVQAV